MATPLSAMFGAGDSTTFLGLPSAELTDLPGNACAVLLGVDTVTPYASVGAYCAGGADAIRAGAADFAANRDHVNFDFGAATLPKDAAVYDAGNLPVNPARAEANREAVEAAVHAIAGRGAVPILLGGDDSLPYPLIRGLADADAPVWIVQVDAHLDWRDEVQGERFGLSSPMRRASEVPGVAGIVQIGLRGIGSARASDRADALAWGADLVPMRDVAREGVAAALAKVPEGAKVVLVFDWDALDPSIMPSVIARTPGGLDYWHAIEIIATLSDTCHIVGASFAEFMASGDIDGQGARVAAQVVITMLGYVARGRA